jgi:hypothetical protein
VRANDAGYTAGALEVEARGIARSRRLETSFDWAIDGLVGNELWPAAFASRGIVPLPSSLTV